MNSPKIELLTPSAPTGEPAVPAKAQYFPALDGLRALAFLIVFSVHITPPVVENIWGPMTGGYLGLDLFFVLSGFLITTILVSEYARKGSINLKKFYLRRSIRLLPATFIFVLAVFIVTHLDHVFRASGADSRRQALGSLSYFYNWIAIYSTNRGHNVGFVGSLWSLSIEEQFYMVFPPLMVFALYRRRKREQGESPENTPMTVDTLQRHLKLIVVILSIGLVLSNVLITSIGWIFERRDSYERALWGTDTRASGFILGALAAIVRIGYPTLYAKFRPHLRWLTPICAVVFSAACFAFPLRPNPLPFAGGLLAMDLCVVVLVLGAVEGSSKWYSYILQLRPLRWVGSVSYGAYVVHYMLVWRFFYQDPLFFRFAYVKILAITLVLSALSFYLIERPLARTLRRRWSL